MLKLGQTLRWIGLGVELVGALLFVRTPPTALFAALKVQTICLAGVGVGVLFLMAGHVLMFVARDRLRRAQNAARFDRSAENSFTRST
ncbi:MAG: hypothetical protein KGM43_08230 [Planctomycetota bacterium]|nr:hypothetical protein [Planctomycetota bacterium]